MSTRIIGNVGICSSPISVVEIVLPLGNLASTLGPRRMLIKRCLSECRKTEVVQPGSKITPTGRVLVVSIGAK